MGNVFGKLFSISTWGESHGPSIGVVIDGCPPRLPLDLDSIQQALARRRPGQSTITTPRNEADHVEILSGVYEGLTLGTPLAMMIRNEDARGKDYSEMAQKYRPSHADFTYDAKYGIRNPEGGGRSSARETAARVAAGAVAQKLLGTQNIEVCSYVERVQDISMPDSCGFPSLEEIDATPIRCPHPETAENMVARIKAVRDKGDSIGGAIVCRVRGLPPGLGAPVFDRLEADLSKAMLSLPATKGFEVGSGFSGTYLKGSEHNDPFEMKDGKVTTKTNRSGGVQGGISNGQELCFRIAFKPTGTILMEQDTVSKSGEDCKLKARGRHDPCVLPRAVPIVDAMTALVLTDHWMLHHAQNHSFKLEG